jgi:hypothetical protein
MPAALRKVFSVRLLGISVGSRGDGPDAANRAQNIAIVFEASAERQDGGGNGIEVSGHGEK